MNIVISDLIILSPWIWLFIYDFDGLKGFKVCVWNIVSQSIKKINIVNAGRKRKRRGGIEHEHAYETEFKVHLWSRSQYRFPYSFSFLKKCYLQITEKKVYIFMQVVNIVKAN